MSMTTDEQALRSALSDAVTGQPAAPHDRIDAVRRRHAHRRQRQLAAVGTAAVVAVAGATLGVLSVRSGGDGSAQFAKRNVPSWALSWPDVRDPSIKQKVLDGAVRAWSRGIGRAGGATAQPQQVIWYRAATVLNHQVVVMFEVRYASGEELVIGHAESDLVSTGYDYEGPDYTGPKSAWNLSVVDAPAPGKQLVFGLNLTGPRVYEPDKFADNEIVVFADPRARSFDWHVTDADGQVRQATSPLDAGFAAVDTGQVRDRVRIDAVRDRDGNLLAHDFAVGVPGAPDSYHPLLTYVPQFTDVGSSGQNMGGSVGQGDSFVEEHTHSSSWPMHRTTVFARCYGGPSIVVSIDSDKPGHRVVIPCDDREHVVSGPPVMAESELVVDPHNKDGHAFSVDAAPETAWRVAVVAD